MDTTDRWVKDLKNLQPKAGEVRRFTTAEATGLRDRVFKKAQREIRHRVLEVRDGVAVFISYDGRGKEVKAEKVTELIR
ncbi:MAG: hypothetical protein Kow0025_21020 [Thermodesulfovibrionales bacterium]